MTHRRPVLHFRAGSRLIAVALALGFTSLLVAVAGASPIETFRLLWDGSLGTGDKFANTVMTWVPLVLASAGLVITFSAGLWNIGVEGQIVMGAIAASWVAREVDLGTAGIITLAILAGLAGGLLWGLLAGALRVYGRVNEIFGGLGLDFVATGLVVYLVIGPWKRAGIASTSGTDPFPREAWLPTIGNKLAPIAVILAVLAVVGVYALMRGTYFGLRLKAVGANATSAFIIGIRTHRYLLAAMAIGGALAGVAGTVQVIGFQHKLVPAISGGYGFLGILVVLLAAYRAAFIAPIAFFFVMISVGSSQLSLRLGLDSSIGGVIQGTLVLVAVLVGGWQAQRARHGAVAVED
ncbi:MAG: ABC transporter permease [Actinomycetota bacterium]|jgi:simple sugar transport system permease protein|nr:ABC transporter permease [Actinomycetota bacterium]